MPIWIHTTILLHHIKCFAFGVQETICRYIQEALHTLYGYKTTYCIIYWKITKTLRDPLAFNQILIIVALILVYQIKAYSNIYNNTIAPYEVFPVLSIQEAIFSTLLGRGTIHCTRTRSQYRIIYWKKSVIMGSFSLQSDVYHRCFESCLSNKSLFKHIQQTSASNEVFRS